MLCACACACACRRLSLFYLRPPPFFFFGGGGEQELFDGVATLLIKAAKALQVRMGVRAPDQDKDDENAMNESAGQHPEAPFRG